MRALAGLLFPALLLAGCNPGARSREEAIADQHPLGLFTSLPLMWGEHGDIAAMLSESEKKDWVRDTLEQRFALTALDTLDSASLAGLDRLALIQPRPLAPQENVALDNWVRGGGRLLVFADPMLTRHSDFPIGDKRRPQDVVLISPILKRWGLELHFDEDQPDSERVVQAYGGSFPVRLPGQFVAVPPGAPSQCIVSPNGLLAQCTVGKGRVTLFADAAILDWEGEGDFPPGRRAALDQLVAAALDY